MASDDEAPVLWVLWSHCFTAIIPRSTLTLGGSTCLGPINGLNRSSWKLFVLDRSTWNPIIMCKLFVLNKNTWNDITVHKEIIINIIFLVSFSHPH